MTYLTPELSVGWRKTAITLIDFALEQMPDRLLLESYTVRYPFAGLDAGSDTSRAAIPHAETERSHTSEGPADRT